MALVIGQDVADAIGMPVADAACELAADAADELVRGYLRTDDPAAVWENVPPVVAAACAVAVEIYQARTAVGGDQVALDYTPGPRMGWTMLRRHAGLLTPYLSVRTMVG